MKIERQLQGTLNTIFTELIKEKGLEGRIQPYTVQEEHRADITLKNKNGKTIFFIELKDPNSQRGRSIFDSETLLREIQRAQKHEIKYFGICNFIGAAFFDAANVNKDKVAVQDGPFSVTDINRLSVNYSLTKEIENKLRSIAEFYLERAIDVLEKKTIKFADLDELFIFKIRKLIEVYAQPISSSVWKQYQSDKAFKKKIQDYTKSQLWNIPTAYDEIENLTHIGVLMLISKLIFYKTYVDNQTFHKLHPMKVPDLINSPDKLEEHIWNYFETFQDVTGNFELLIGERDNIIFKIPFVSDAVIDLVKEILDTGGHYNFSNIPFDIIGRIFEELIREDERHKLGQYFTPPHVIDLINAFAIRKSSDKVFDPSCGSGTFLVRAYERKKLLCAEEDKGARHEILLNEIYGNDLSGYPAYLSMLNLAIRNTRKPSYPRIANKDFFAITENSKIDFHNQHGEKESKSLPKFDAVVGNPPYTRQEDIGTMHGTVNKVKIQTLIKQECGFEPSQRTSIYGYFFYHASVFLKDRGYLAFICQNSWLDTDYGIDMQRYLMRNYEIVAIIDSEVERFFPSASVNTTIVIVRKQRDEDARNENTVKFIYFTSTLAEAIKNYKGTNKLHDILQNTNESESNDFFRINCIHQETLKKFTKWGQFLKAPKVYFDIIERGNKIFSTLCSEVIDAKIQRGYTTGCNHFFILKDITDNAKDGLLQVAVNNIHELETIKQVKKEKLRLVENGFNELWLIEEQFLFPILMSPKDLNVYEVKDTIIKLLSSNLKKNDLKNDYPYLFEYVKWGERRQLNNGSTLASRSIWYNQGTREIPFLSFNRIMNDFGKTYSFKGLTSDMFYNIYISKDLRKTLLLYLNSTISWLVQQLMIRVNFGDGAGEIKVYEFEEFPIPVIDLEDLKVDLGETKNFKEELGTLESLKTVNPERVKLDSAILEAIGYKNKKERDDVLLKLYQATYQLIDARLQKAQSLKGVKTQRNKVEFSVYVEQIKEMLVEGKHEAKNTYKFAKQLEKMVREISSESKLQKKILDAYWKEKFGEMFNEKEIAAQEQEKLF